MDGLAHTRLAPELSAGGGARLVRRHPAGDVVVDLVADVGLDLVVELVAVPRRIRPGVAFVHHHSVAGPSTRATACTSDSHRLRSCSRCFRPFGVIR